MPKPIYLLITLFFGQLLTANTFANGQTEFTDQLAPYYEQQRQMAFGIYSADDVQFSLKQSLEQLAPPQCNNGFNFEWRGQPEPGNNTLKASCPGLAWQRYLSIYIKVFKHVVVSSEPMTRGEVLSAAVLTTRRMDISTLRLGYFDNIKELNGYYLQRTLKSGQVLTPFVAKAPDIVQRGDWVTILSGTGALIVSSTGEAMKSGKLGEQIPVKNLRSKITVRAWIVKKGTVSTRINQI